MIADATEATTASGEIADRIRALEGSGMRTFVEDPPIVWARASGATVVDADGTAYLDLASSFAVAAVGHQHPAVVEAVRRQAGELMHCSSSHPSRVRAEFYEAVASIAPPGLSRVLPAITGAMANEAALAIARVRRPHGPVLAFQGGYFGRSAGTVGFAGKARYRDALGIEAQARLVPYADPIRLGDTASDVVMEALERAIAAGSSPPAAVLLEPVQGNGGVVVPAPGFLGRIRELCDRIGALMIVDEIQSGCGRTGRMWAIEHASVTPDLVTIGKGIGGGVAVAALLGGDDVMSTLAPDAYSSTFLTNNLNLAAAVAAIGVLRDDDLPERAARLAREVADGPVLALRELPGVGAVTHLGLWSGIRFVDDDGHPDAGRARRVAAAARADGVLVGRGGYDQEVVKIAPPLVIDEDDLAGAIGVVSAAIGTTA